MEATLAKELSGLFAEKKVAAAYLFGSRADGTAYPGSDYDFGILLEQKPLPSDISLVMQELSDDIGEILNQEVDIVILNSAGIELRYEVISHGQLIFSADDDKRTDFEDVVIRDYLDFKPFIDEYYREVNEAVREGGFFG